MEQARRIAGTRKPARADASESQASGGRVRPPSDDLAGTALADMSDMARDTVNALEFLKSQHDEVEDLISRIESAKGERKEILFAMLADNLAAHSKIEELIFYPMVMARQTEELLLENLVW